MNPELRQVWRAPRWALSILLAMLGMLGPFSIDTCIPAFAGIAASLHATPIQMQQILSAYLLGFAFMSLFHGAISDSIGRRPVVLWGLAAFTLSSIGCALAQNITQLVFFRLIQGLTTGAGIVVSRAVVRDIFPVTEAQKVMSQITIYFGIAPAIAPMIGGVLFTWLGWNSVFWFLAALGIFLWLVNYHLLPETLSPERRQTLKAGNLLRGYWQLGRDPRFLLLALASGIPFNGMFLYVMSAPVFLGQHLGLPVTHFFWFFVLVISGIMLGAWLSGRLAGHISAKRQIKYGFGIMFGVSMLNLAANVMFSASATWAMLPIMFFSFGWALMVPAVTLLVLDLHPERRGMASSLQVFVGSSANGLVAGLLAPLVMHSTILLAGASLLLLLSGLIAWLLLRRNWPAVGA